MLLWDSSPPSSWSAGFPNKVTISGPTTRLSFVGLQCSEQYNLGLNILKSLLMKLKVESEKVGLKRNIQKN